jgi:predicted nucleic acid-binding protein
VSQPVQDRYVDLTAWAKHSGHAVYDKTHTADRWIAATALSHDLELASRDGLFVGIAGLRLLTLEV